jgi:hypothetical protein
VLAGFGLGDVVLWVGSGEVTAVGDVQRAEGEERGVLGAFFFFSSTSHGSGRGRGGWAQPRRLSRHGYRVRASENSEAHSSFDFSGFCLPRVRSNARKNLNFKFLKTATVVHQHIGPGFQNYFCYQEITCFAKICI